MALGQAIVKDNFDYGASAGDLTSVTGNWNGHSGGSPNIGYITTSLSMASYPSSGVGGSITASTSGSQDVSRTFPMINSGNVYASALVNVSSASTSPNYFYHFIPFPI